MGEANGWIKLHRRVLENAWLQNPELWAYWTYCLLKAGHKRRRILFNGEYIDLKEGQFVTGILQEAKELKTTHRKIRTFRKRLEKMGNVTYQTTHRYSIVTICNWNTYQGTEKENDTVSDNQVTHWRHTGDTLSDNKQEVKKEKNDKNDKNTYSANFEKIWSELLPQMKVGKKNAYRHYKTSVRTVSDEEKIFVALENYKNCDRVKRGYVQNGSTWFNNWHDWIDYKDSDEWEWADEEK